MMITSWQGIHNTNPIRSIPDNALADAVDVDIDDAGILLARRGYAMAKPMPIVSSYLTADQVPYLVVDGRLYRVADAGLVLVEIAPCVADAFADASEYLFTLDGLQVFRDQATDLVVPPPPPPSVTVTGGNWSPGRYLITATQVAPSGLMSGTAPVQTVVLPSMGGLAINPVADPGFTPLIWLTEAQDDAKTGGEVFYRYGGLETLPSNFLGASGWLRGAEKIAYFDGRICLSVPFSGHTAIYFSQRNQFHLFNLAKDVVIIPGHIEAMLDTASALIVATGTEIYATDLTSLDKLADYGVPTGRSMAKHPDNGKVYIHSNRGICACLPFENLTGKTCSLPAGAHCSAHFVHQRGMQQFVVLHDQQTTAFNPFTLNAP